MNKNNKSYQKVYFNGDCIVDFTQQTVNENNVASGNMFFDTEGNLIEGKDDSLLVLNGYVDYSYWDTKGCDYNKLGLRLAQVDCLTY